MSSLTGKTTGKSIFSPGRVSQRFLAYSALVIGIISLSMSAIFIRWADAPGLMTTFYRMTFGALFLSPLIFWRVTIKRQSLNKYIPWMPVAILGGVVTSLDHATWAIALSYSKVANVTLLNYIAPVWVAIFSLVVWKEKLGNVFWIGLFLTLSGAVVIFGYDLYLAPHMGRGDGLAVISSTFYAGFILITRWGRRFLDTLLYVWLATVASSVTLLIINLVVGNSFSGYSTTTYLAFVGAAIIPQVMGYLALTYALGHLPAHIVSPSMIAQPVLTAILALPFTGEKLLPGVITGGILVLAGIFFVNRGQDAGTAST